MKQRLILIGAIAIIGLILYLVLNLKSCDTSDEKQPDDKREVISNLIAKNDSLHMENLIIESEALEIYERKEYYKRKFNNFKSLDTIFKYIFLDSDTVEITNEIENKINAVLLKENELLKLKILKNKSIEQSNLAAISHELTEKAVLNSFHKKQVRYKYSFLLGYGIRSDLSDLKPIQGYNIGLSYDFNKRIGVGLLGTFEPKGLKYFTIDENNVGFNILLKYNFNM